MIYTSPIEVTYENAMNDVTKYIDEEIYRAVIKVGISVDRDELVKALQYDRDQYEKGYIDCNSEIVRCKECRYRTKKWHDLGTVKLPYYECGIGNSSLTLDEDYCSKGERDVE